LSQPTRARTTGGARKPRSAPPDTALAQTTPAGEDTAFTPETLARTLRAVATELERDPDLARRVAASVAATSTDATPAASLPTPEHPDAPATPSRLNRTFRPRLVTGASPDLGPGIPDPIALYQKLGADGLRAALDELRLGSLRAIIREHSLDLKGTLTRQNDAARLRDAILAAALAKAQK